MAARLLGSKQNYMWTDGGRASLGRAAGGVVEIAEPPIASLGGYLGGNRVLVTLSSTGQLDHRRMFDSYFPTSPTHTSHDAVS